MNPNAFKVEITSDQGWTIEAFSSLFGTFGEAPDDCSCPDTCVCEFDTRGAKTHV